MVTRINNASRSIAQHEHLSKLAFQIDDFDADFAQAAEMAKLLDEYLLALYDITSQGNRAPYAVALSSAIYDYRRRQGTPLKFARKAIQVEDWEPEELWRLLCKRIETAIGTSDVATVARQLGIELTEVPTATWGFDGNDGPCLVGLLPRPRFFVLLWQDLIANRSSGKPVPSRIWKSHVTIASEEIEVFLSARYKDVTPLLREIGDSRTTKLDVASLVELRNNVVNSAPTGNLWVSARVSDLLANMCLAGVLAENPASPGNYRVRRKLLPSIA